MKFKIIGMFFWGEIRIFMYFFLFKVIYILNLNLLDWFDIVIVLFDGKLYSNIMYILNIFYLVIYIFVMGIGIDLDILNF